MSFAESFTALETLLPCLIYPVCYHSELEAVLDCNLEDRTCLPTVHCIYCGYNAGLPTIQHELEAIQQLLSGETIELSCPACLAQSHLEFRCTLAEQRCSSRPECLAVKLSTNSRSVSKASIGMLGTTPAQGRPRAAPLLTTNALPAINALGVFQGLNSPNLSLVIVRRISSSVIPSTYLAGM